MLPSPLMQFFVMIWAGFVVCAGFASVVLMLEMPLKFQNYLFFSLAEFMFLEKNSVLFGSN